MKKCLILILLLTCLCLWGCEKEEVVTEQTLPAQTEPLERRVSNSHGYANMSLAIPDGWEYEVTEYSPETGNFGIVFRPEGEQVGSLSLMYYDGWAVCGTEMDEKLHYIGDRETYIGTYHGQKCWNYIKFNYLPGDYVFFNTGADAWYDKYEAQINDILASAVLADGVMTYAQAEQIALDWAGEQECGVYEVVYSGFYMENGAWEILLGAINNTGPDHTIHIFPDSSVKEVVVPQE